MPNLIPNIGLIYIPNTYQPMILNNKLFYLIFGTQEDQSFTHCAQFNADKKSGYDKACSVMDYYMYTYYLYLCSSYRHTHTHTQKPSIEYVLRKVEY